MAIRQCRLSQWPIMVIKRVSMSWWPIMAIQRGCNLLMVDINHWERVYSINDQSPGEITLHSPASAYPLLNYSSSVGGRNLLGSAKETPLVNVGHWERVYSPNGQYWPLREVVLFQWPILAIERVSTLLMDNTGHQEDGEFALSMANIGDWESVDVLDGQY